VSADTFIDHQYIEWLSVDHDEHLPLFLPNRGQLDYGEMHCPSLSSVFPGYNKVFGYEKKIGLRYLLLMF
jgi:hypothetical protein